ncbi:MAG: response regulator [Leptospiraceae bacterium]|nr:response regulator [Leptospiraceae bacterium]MCP5496394.1 response regulator [Leptospiraceae bacterium]
MYKEPQKKILVVEDELQISEMMQIMLQKNGYNVAVCKNGKEALDLHIKESFPLIITDLNMPSYDGEYLIDELNKREILPVLLAHTVVTDVNKVIELMKKGVYDYILKPSKQQEFLHRVNKAFDYYLLQKFQRSVEKEREIRTEYQLNWSLWQEESINRNLDKKDLLLFDSLRTNFSQGQGFGALVSTLEFIQSLCKLDGDYYKVEKEIMEMVFYNVKALNKIIDLFGEIRKILRDGLVMEDVHIDDFFLLIDDVIQELNQYSSQKNQTIKLFQNGTLNKKHKLKIHKDYIKIVLRELLLNAFKYSHKDSEIIIMTEIVKNNFFISILNKPEIEIPEECSRIIFEPFYRISKFAYDTYPTYDIGLGLTLVDKIVRQHEGRITMFNVKSYLTEDSQVLNSFQIELSLY